MRLDYIYMWDFSEYERERVLRIWDEETGYGVNIPLRELAEELQAVVEEYDGET